MATRPTLTRPPNLPERSPPAPRRLPPGTPYAPFEWLPADVVAFQALAAGNASPHQQRRALDTLIVGLARTYDLHYHPASDRDTAFALGRAFVGQQIVKLLRLNTSRQQGELDAPDEPPAST